MSVAHLVFAVVTSAYIFLAIRFEERDLIDVHGADYARYRERTPMIMPSLTARTLEADDRTRKAAA